MSDPMPQWRLQLSGTPQLLSAEGACLALERRDAALLALLAIDGPVARNRAAALLWPDEVLEQVRGRLRQRIYALKVRLGQEIIKGKATLCFTPTLRWPGFGEERAEGALLGDDAYADMPEFADWLGTMRDRLQSVRRERLAGEASSLEQRGELAKAIVCAERLLALEPLQEHAHRRLMRLHYLRGDRAAALLAFDRCEQALKHEVSTVPSAETMELLAQIDRAQALAAPAVSRMVPAAVLRPPRLIGRDAEWALLQAAWERGDAVVIVGEAGMGKTRLVDDLVRARASAPNRVLQASARPGDEQVPYALLGRLLRGLLTARAQPLAEGVETELARLLPELPQRGRKSLESDATAQARFFGAIETVLNEAVAAGLEALVLDDLHFADTASLELLQHLICAPGLRWLTAYRGAEIGTPAQGLVDLFAGRLRAEPVLLLPLTRAHVGELLDSLGIAALSTQALAGALHQRTGGNPLFLLETLKALWLQNGVADAALADVAALTRLPVGASAARLIERRIGQLSREAVRLARCAAVAGQDFSAPLAARALDVNPLDLADAWNELESAQVMRDGAFAHDLIFEAARASVPEPIARALHRRMAELMEADGAAPARLAAHWLGAGEPLRAAPHLAAAGRLARHALRMREAVDYLDQAQAIYGRAGEFDAQCALIDELVEPAVMAGTFDSVLQLVERAAHNACTDRQRSMTLRSLASVLEFHSEYERARQVARQSLDLALAARDRACELSARSLLANLQGDMGHGSEGEATLRAIEPWVTTHGSPEQQLAFAQALANVLRGGGKMVQSLDQYDRAIAMARKMGAAQALPALLDQRAYTLIFTGRMQEARDAMLEGQRLLPEAPNDAMIHRPQNIRQQVLDRMLGLYTSSLELGDRVLADPAVGHAEVDEIRLAFAYAFCDLGQPARVRQLAAQPRFEANAFNELLWKAVIAQLPQRTAQPDEARASVLQAAADAATQWTGRNLLTALREQARFGDEAQAMAAARQGAEFAEAGGMRGHQLVFQAFLAQRLARRGDFAEAVLLAKDSWRLMAEFSTGLTYRGVVWQALVEVLAPRDAALARTILRSAADWIYRTAAEQVPPAFRESFLQRNRANAELLRQVRTGKLDCAPGIQA
jgi:DNA-binding SARP family transcriptional activator/predicted ATPase